MCGITGQLNFNQEPVVKEDLVRMTDALRHRGPDGCGYWQSGPVGLGHRRLAIIDPSGGHQPMAHEAQDQVLTFNGEIYNFNALREELKSLGYTFRTRCDTEVVLQAYRAWGMDCVRRFRGMFAFAIADMKQQCLFLARDHLGIKPLYYWHNPHQFAFASEIQALLALPQVRRQPDLAALNLYLGLQYVPAPQTGFKGIHKLAPAQCMTIPFSQPTFQPETYWQLRFEPDLSLDESEWLEILDQALYESVQAHLVADVPYGAFLSGGIDSSLVVAYMSQILKQPVRTFSIGFNQKEYDETSYAKLAADRMGTEHTSLYVEEKDIDIIDQLIPHYGEPFGDSSAVPTYWVSKIARKQVTMVLSGDGGDELFAGYRRYYRWLHWLNFEDCDPQLAPIVRPLAKYLPLGAWDRRPNSRNWFPFVSIFPNGLRRQLWQHQDFRPPKQLDLDLADLSQVGITNPIQVGQYLDIRTYLPGDILTKVDRASMFHSLEARTPITDIRIMELAARIPPSILFKEKRYGCWIEKALLKKLAGKFYPPHFIHRPKRGFAIPLKSWLARVEMNKENKQKWMLSEIFDPNALEGVMRTGNASQQWLLLMLEKWMRWAF